MSAKCANLDSLTILLVFGSRAERAISACAAFQMRLHCSRDASRLLEFLFETALATILIHIAKLSRALVWLDDAIDNHARGICPARWRSFLVHECKLCAFAPLTSCVSVCSTNKACDRRIPFVPSASASRLTKRAGLFAGNQHLQTLVGLSSQAERAIGACVAFQARLRYA